MELPPPVPVPDPLGGGGGGGFSDVGVDAPFVEERDEVKVMEELELKIQKQHWLQERKPMVKAA